MQITSIIFSLLLYTLNQMECVYPCVTKSHIVLQEMKLSFFTLFPPDLWCNTKSTACKRNLGWLVGEKMTVNESLFEGCLKNNFGVSIYDCNMCYSLQDVALWDIYLHASIVSLLMLASLFGNFLFFAVLLKYKKLRHRTSVVSFSFLLANTCFVFSVHLPVVISTLSRNWPFGFVGCQVIGFLSTQFILARWLNMGLLALDRFNAVRFPFYYSKHSKYILTFQLSFSWIVPALLSIVTVQGYASVVFRSNVPSCLLYAPTIERGLLYFAFVSTFSFVIGAILPVVLYSWLFNKARQLRSLEYQVGKMTSQNSSSSIVNSEHSKERLSREKKALLTFGIIFVGFCLTGVPSYLFQVIRWFNTDAWCGIPIWLHFRVTEFYLSATAIDPFSVMRGRDFRKRLRHILCCHNNCGKYYANRSIHSEIPPERNLDAVRTLATKALSLAVSKDSIRDTTTTSKCPSKVSTSVGSLGSNNSGHF